MGRNRRRKMHDGRDGTQHSYGVMNQTHKDPKRCLGNKIDNAMQGWMPFFTRTDLHEKHSSAKRIHDFLVIPAAPAFNWHPGFAPGGYDPVRPWDVERRGFGFILSHVYI